MGFYTRYSNQTRIITGVLTGVIAIAYLKLCEYLATKRMVSPLLSRKLIHIGMGFVFILCWLMYDINDPMSPYIASAVPFLIALQFGLLGIGVLDDSKTVHSMSRTGKASELLYGPFMYGVVFVFITMFYFRDLNGIVALLILCGGDGMSEIIGRRYGRTQWTIASTRKTFEGTLGFVVGSMGLCFLTLSVYEHFGVWNVSSGLLTKILLITLGAAFVEVITPGNIDNITVPAASLALGHIVFT